MKYSMHWFLRSAHFLMLTRRLRLVTVVACSLAFASSVRADNQRVQATLTACCGSGCASASCSGDAEVYVSTDNNSCSPDCYLTALLVQPDSSVSANCMVNTSSTYRFVKVTDPNTSICTDDVGSPFSLTLPLNSALHVTNAQWLQITGGNVVVEATTSTVTATMRGSFSKTSNGSSSNVPTVSTWGLLALGVLLLAIGTAAIRRMRSTPITRA